MGIILSLQFDSTTLRQALLFAVLICYTLAAQAASLYDNTSLNDFNWTSLTPSQDLVYHTCFDKFQCARLLVPLDWDTGNSNNSHDRIAIAVIKLPSTVASTNNSYAGPVFVNPGGPAASGVDFLKSNDRLLQSIINGEASQFDIISFDPRGVGVSEPYIECFSSAVDQALWHAKYEASSTAGINGSDIRLPWARARSIASQCSHKGVGKYLSTAYMAQDLLHLLEMETLATSDRLKPSTRKRQRHVEDMISTVKTFRRDEPPGLQYLGLSYGTFLGTTFASMFPHRVKRMVLDGVIDANQYFHDDGYSGIRDTEKVLDRYYEYCYKLGQSCPIYNENGPGQIRQEVDQILFDLDQEPMVVIDDTGNLPPEVLTGRDLRQLIFNSLYRPSLRFPLLGHLLEKVKTKQPQELLPLILSRRSFSCPITLANVTANTMSEAALVYTCGDAEDATNRTIAQFQDSIKHLESRSSLAGAIIAEKYMACTAWYSRPAWKSNTSFGSTSPTLQPILWLGNRLDPITPIENAYRMSECFANSGVLEQDGVGHVALMNDLSNCTVEFIKRYFATGKLPQNQTMCPGESTVFATTNSLSTADKKRAYAYMSHPLL